MLKFNQKVERCSFLISRSVKCVTRTGNLLLLISSLILRCFAKVFHFKNTRFSTKNLVIKEKISGSGRTELSTFVVRVTHLTVLEIRKLHLSTFWLHFNLLLYSIRTGNLLLLISSLILRCFAKVFHLLCIFIYLKHIDYNKMLKCNQKVERCSFLISRSCININYYDLYVLSVKIHGFPLKIS
jgi:hypothetical protein